MENFWFFASFMTKYKARMYTAITCAIVAAFFFGGSIGLMVPVLRTVMVPDESKNFRTFLADVDQKLAKGLIPDSLIEMIPDDKFTGFIYLMIFWVATSVIGSALRMVHNYLSMTLIVYAVSDIRIKIFSKMVRMPMAEVLREPISEKISKVLRDANQLARGYTAMLSKTMGELLKGIAALITAFVLDWQLSALALLLTPVLALYYKMHGRSVRKKSRRVLAESARMLGVITQSMMGMRVVKVHTAERFEMGRFRRTTRDYNNAEIPLKWRKSVASPTIEIITSISFACLAVFAAWRIISNPDSGGDGLRMLTAIAGIAIAAGSLRQFTFLFNEIAESTSAADRLRELYETEPEREDPHEVLKKFHLPAFTHTLQFEHVNFQYPTAERPTLRDINLSIERGRMYAFVGPNGCGKTTLLSLVPRLFDPTTGRVMIDGHDLRQVTLRSLRRQIGVVTQETVLFHDTIANNIAYGMSNVSREQVIEVAQSAYADEFIRNKPQGYDTFVGEHGSSLSGGERQRLAIARAILRDPSILILDEATSMIDATSEAAISAALDVFCRGRTSLVIAHRLSTVVNADQIVVMEDGGIVDIGTHDELLERCNLYMQLCKHQLVADSNGGGDHSDSDESD